MIFLGQNAYRSKKTFVELRPKVIFLGRTRTKRFSRSHLVQMFSLGRTSSKCFSSFQHSQSIDRLNRVGLNISSLGQGGRNTCKYILSCKFIVSCKYIPSPGSNWWKYDQTEVGWPANFCRPKIRSWYLSDFQSIILNFSLMVKLGSIHGSN